MVEIIIGFLMVSVGFWLLIFAMHSMIDIISKFKNKEVNMISKTITKKYAGGLIVTVFKYNDTKQVKKKLLVLKT